MLVLLHGKSERQLIVTLSLKEAEYMSPTIAAKEAIGLHALLKKLEYDNNGKLSVHLYEDNMPAIDLIKRPATNGRNKHIEIRWHFI